MENIIKIRRLKWEFLVCNKWGWGDSEKHYADPFVVALAKTYDLKVVTYETGNNPNSIGRACELLNVEISRFIDFLRDEDLIFR